MYYFCDSNDASVLGHDDDDEQQAMLGSSASGSWATETVETKADSPPLLGKDEILQTKIMYSGKCNGWYSRVHKVEYLEKESIIVETDRGTDKGANNSTNKECESENKDYSLSHTNLINEMHDGQRLCGLKQVKQTERQNVKTKDGGDNGNTTKNNEPSSPSYWEKVIK